MRSNLMHLNQIIEHLFGGNQPNLIRKTLEKYYSVMVYTVWPRKRYTQG